MRAVYNIGDASMSPLLLESYSRRCAGVADLALGEVSYRRHRPFPAVKKPGGLAGRGYAI